RPAGVGAANPRACRGGCHHYAAEPHACRVAAAAPPQLGPRAPERRGGGRSEGRSGGASWGVKEGAAGELRRERRCTAGEERRPPRQEELRKGDGRGGGPGARARGGSRARGVRPGGHWALAAAGGWEPETSAAVAGAAGRAAAAVR